MADLHGQRLASVFGKAKIAMPAHDDLVQRQFRAAGPNRVWLTDKLTPIEYETAMTALTNQAA